jgi:hypothetical protein
MPTPPYRFNARAYSYTDARGQFVSRRAVRDALDEALSANTGRMRALAEALRDGRLSIAEWQVQMAREVKNAHLYSAAAAKGGWQNMTPADYRRVGQRIREQYAFLNAFAAQVASGQQAMDGRMVARAELYGQAGRATYHHVERGEMEVRGMTEESSVLHPADSCDECIAEADAGWQPIGTLTPVGERACLGRCRCTLDYR